MVGGKGFFAANDETVIHWDPARVITRGSDENNDNDNDDTFSLLVLNQPLHNATLLDLVWRKGEPRWLGNLLSSHHPHPHHHPDHDGVTKQKLLLI
jgi:hypothetical protein